METTMTEMKIILDGINDRLDTAIKRLVNYKTQKYKIPKMKHRGGKKE